MTRSFALTALSQIGSREDIPLLQSVIDERKAQGIDPATDGLQHTAQQAIVAISSGTQRERRANQKLPLDAGKPSKGVGIAVVLGVIAAVLAVVMGLRGMKRERAGMSL